LTRLDLDNNPSNPELAAAYKQGLTRQKPTRAKAAAQITLNEAKLILSAKAASAAKVACSAALRGDPWEEGRPTRTASRSQPVQVTAPDTKTEITQRLDFGGSASTPHAPVVL